MTFGTLTTDGTHHVVRFERLLAHPRERVWAALTEPAQRAVWFFAGELPTQVGGAVDLTDSDRGVHGVVTAVRLGSTLEFTWDSVDGPEGTVRFELSDTADGGTLLVLTHTVTGGRPENLLPGWHRIVVDDLPEYLDSGQVTEKPGRWAMLRDQHYAPLVAAKTLAAEKPD